MRIVLQRVTSASVEVDGEVVGRIEPGRGERGDGGQGHGLVALVGVTHGDTAEQAVALARKVWTLRILGGERGEERAARSAADVAAPILVVSQFTLYADTRKGRRPSWNDAAPGPVAEPLVDAFAAELRALGAPVATGSFGAHMRLNLCNDGPVTILLDG